MTSREELIKKHDEVMGEIAKLQKVAEQLGNELQKLKGKEDKDIRWKPKGYLDSYYFLGSTGGEVKARWTDSEIDDFRYNLDIIRRTEEEIKTLKRNLLVRQQLKDLALELNDGVKLDFKDEHQKKYYIYVVYRRNYPILLQSCTTTALTNSVAYCLNNNFLKIAKERLNEVDIINAILYGNVQL